jgi:hypothetical protein
MKLTTILCAAVLSLCATQTRSQQSGHWEVRLVGYHQDGRPHYARLYCHADGRCFRPRRPQVAQLGATRVYSYERRELVEATLGCREHLRAVGDQHLTVDGAKKAANEAWAGTVRFHLGEKFMDLANARNIVYTCSRSSIKEGGVTTLGQTLTRCEIEAQPCHPPRQLEAADK